MNESMERSPGRKLDVLAISDSKDGTKSRWTRVGVAFTNRDGSVTLFLDAFPIGTNKLQVREPWEDRNHGARKEEVRT